MSPVPGLSGRARRVLTAPPTPEYIDAHFPREADAWDATSNPDGYIGLCVAENRLVFDLLEPKLAASRRVTTDALGYDAMTGSMQFREVLASFLGRTFIGRDISAEHLAVLNGVGSVLELLFYVLCDRGDGVLVPTPSYTGFWADIETRDEVTIVPVDCRSDDDFALTAPLLDAAVESAGRPVKALLFTNPNNPLARIHTREEVCEVMEWAQRRGVHLVLDEIYALSVFGDTPFVSGGRLVDDMPDWLHIVWGFSKDFAMSGFRSGVLYTENTDVLAAVDALAYWAATSGDTQSVLRQMLSDEEWVDGYLAENQRRLRSVYEQVTAVLDSYEVRHLRADAGLFFVIDLREILTDQTWEAEDEVWRSLLDDAGVNITPGSACHNAEPGLMRLVFSCVSPEAAVEGAHRIGRFVADRRV